MDQYGLGAVINRGSYDEPEFYLRTTTEFIPQNLLIPYQILHSDGVCYWTFFYGNVKSDQGQRLYTPTRIRCDVAPHWSAVEERVNQRLSQLTPEERQQHQQSVAAQPCGGGFLPQPQQQLPQQQLPPPCRPQGVPQPQIYSPSLPYGIQQPTYPSPYAYSPPNPFGYPCVPPQQQQMTPFQPWNYYPANQGFSYPYQYQQPYQYGFNQYQQQPMQHQQIQTNPDNNASSQTPATTVSQIPHEPPQQQGQATAECSETQSAQQQQQKEEPASIPCVEEEAKSITLQQPEVPSSSVPQATPTKQSSQTGEKEATGKKSDDTPTSSSQGPSSTSTPKTGLYIPPWKRTSSSDDIPAAKSSSKKKLSFESPVKTLDTSLSPNQSSANLSLVSSISDISLESKELLEKALNRKPAQYDMGLRCNLLSSESIKLTEAIENLPLIFRAVKYFHLLAKVIRHIKEYSTVKSLDVAIINEINQAENNVFQQEPEEYDQYCRIMEMVLQRREPVHVLLRSMEGNNETNNFKSMDESDEIALMLLKNYVLYDAEVFDRLLRKSQLLVELRSIQLAQPDPLWFQNSGSSFLMQIHDKALPPNVTQIRPKGIPCEFTFKGFLSDLASALLNVGGLSLEAKNKLSSIYGELRNTHEVDKQLGLLIAKNARVIERFSKFGKTLQFKVSCSKSEIQIVDQLHADFRMTREYWQFFVKRMLQVLRSHGREMDLTTVSKTELLGIKFLLDQDLASIDLIQRPNSIDYQPFLVEIFGGENADAGVVEALSNFLLESLNIGFLYASINLLCQLSMYRLGVERTLDQLIYLLQKDLFTTLEPFHPKWEDSASRIESKYKKVKSFKKEAFGRTDNEKKGREKHLLEEDAKKSKQMVVVCLQFENKFYYNLLDIHGNPDPLFLATETDTLTGFDLYSRAHEFGSALGSAIDNYKKRTNAIVTVAQCQTEAYAGGNLDLALEVFHQHKHDIKVMSLPIRIPLFYKVNLNRETAESLLRKSWEAFRTNQGHLAKHLGQYLDDDLDSQLNYHIVDWAFLVGRDRNLLGEIMCTYLTTAIARTRVDLSRAIRDPTYAEVIRFLVHCPRDRMIEILGDLAQHKYQNKKERDTLFRKCEKAEILAVFGLNQQEIHKYGMFFKWGEEEVDEGYFKKKFTFNALFPEKNKPGLYEFLKSNVGQYKEAQTLAQVANKFTSQAFAAKESDFPGKGFDKMIFYRFQDPDSSFMANKRNSSSEFGQEHGVYHQNVTTFSIRQPHSLKFTMSHLPPRYLLRSLIAVFKNDHIHPDMVHYVSSEANPHTPNLVAQSQAYLLCLINKNLRYQIQRRHEIMFYVSPVWDKPKNTFINHLEPPTPAHYFDLTTQLQQIVFFDNRDKYRAAGREVESFVNVETMSRDRIFEDQLTGFKDRYEEFCRSSKIQELAIDEVVLPFPKFDQFYRLEHYKHDRIAVLPIYQCGGYPFHLKVLH